MARYYLSPWTGNGTPDVNPFRVRGADQPGCRVIDLRPDSRVASGFALCVAPVLPTGAGVFDLGDGLDIRSAAIKNGLQTRFGLTLDVDTVREIVKDLLILHARTDGTRWRPLKPTRRGAYEIFLGEQIYQQRPIGGGASHSENWDCGNSASITCQLTWTEFTGTSLTLTSNKAQITGNVGANAARADVDTDTDDHRVEAAAGFTWVGASVSIRVIARKDSSGTVTYYYFGAVKDATNNQHELHKTVAGVETSLGTHTDDFINNEVLALAADGSSITGYKDSVSLIAVTDTDITGNTRGGIRLRSTGASNTATMNDWSIADIAAGAAGASSRMMSMGMG